MSRTPSACSRSAPSSSSSGPSPRIVKPLDSSISAGSLLVVAHHSCSTPILRGRSSRGVNVCQMSACSATSRSVFRSPCPPIRIGMRRVGGGLSRSQRRRMRGRSAGERVEPGADGAELVAVRVVVRLRPARAGAEDERPTPSGPALMWSTVRAISACRSGLRYELQLTSGPNSTRSVCSAIAASTVHASKCGASQRLGEGEEVIPAEDRVHAHVLRAQHRIADRPVRRVLGSELHPDAQRGGGARRVPAHGSILRTLADSPRARSSTTRMPRASSSSGPDHGAEALRGRCTPR